LLEVIAMPTKDNGRERRVNLWGWILFLVCAIFFILSSLQSGSITGLVGSIIFLAGCVVFIIPIMAKGNRSGNG